MTNNRAAVGNGAALVSVLVAALTFLTDRRLGAVLLCGVLAVIGGAYVIAGALPQTTRSGDSDTPSDAEMADAERRH